MTTEMVEIQKELTVLATLQTEEFVSSLEGRMATIHQLEKAKLEMECWLVALRKWASDLDPAASQTVFNYFKAAAGDLLARKRKELEKSPPDLHDH